PLLLLQICKAWREVALSIPALWDTICDTEFSDPQNMENAITTWFGRAGDCLPLSLDVSYTGERSTCMHSLIRRHASRLQFLTLGLDADCFSDLAGIQSFPRLRHLTLTSLDGVLEANGTQIPVFSDSPLLCHLEVEHLAPSRLMMPWSQLTKFTAASVALQECLGVLRLATSLEEFRRVDCPEEEEEGSIIGQPLMCHSDLNSLIVGAYDEADHNILQFLTLPRLEKLQFGGDYGSWTGPLNTAVLQFLSRTFSTLRTFTIGLSPKIPTEWFHITIHLTTLELVGPQYAADVIHALDRRNVPDFLPKLQTLVYSDCTSDQVDINLVNALNSRCANAVADTDTSCARLISFRLIWLQYERAGILPLVHVANLRALASRGMHIHVGTRDHNTF
ncbi:hypothetical protein FB451DRAFT_1246729, partial [Mycena latifolia]